MLRNADGAVKAWRPIVMAFVLVGVTPPARPWAW